MAQQYTLPNKNKRVEVTAPPRLAVPQGGWAPGNVPGWPAGGPSNGMPTDWRSREGG